MRTTQYNIFNLLLELQTNMFSSQRLIRSFAVHFFQTIMFIPILLGTVGFTDQFFSGDQKTSLLLFCLIWLSQIFMNNLCNTRYSKAIFPWFFHFHCIVYLVYYFKYPTGYSYLSFVVCLLLVGRVILYFWNRHEYEFLIRNHPVLRDFLANTNQQQNNNADGQDVAIMNRFTELLSQSPLIQNNTRLMQQLGLGQGATVQNVQQWVFNLNDVNNRSIEQQVGRFNIRVSIADQNNQNN